MKDFRQTMITGFALFSLFFGAGNLILPPLLGYRAGEDWSWVTFGFVLSAVIIPMMALFGHARLQGNMADFCRKLWPGFGPVYSLVIYVIALTLPAPRTASVTYEMAVEPYFQWSSFTLSSVYFALVFVFVLNRSRIISIIGKFLTPLILIILLAIIIIGLQEPTSSMSPSSFDHNFTAGVLEGYQTFDAIGGVVVGGIAVISLGLVGGMSYREKRRILGNASIVAGLGLLLVYGGLIVLGAHYSTMLQTDDRTALVAYLSTSALGNYGNAMLGVLVALACFTTAVGIITGAADYLKELFGNSQKAYVVTAFIGCLSGVLIGQFNVPFIINAAIPALLLSYPLTIVLIVLNCLPEAWSDDAVYKWVVAVTLIFTLPDFLASFWESNPLSGVADLLPLHQQSMAWLIPALLTFILVNLIGRKRAKKIPA
jgi:LIVCS family branched-chain amino acid:cation transporter